MAIDTTGTTDVRISGSERDRDVQERSIYVNGRTIEMRYEGRKNSSYEALSVSFPDGARFLIESRDNGIELSTADYKPVRNPSEFVERFTSLGEVALSKIEAGLPGNIRALLAEILSKQEKARSAS